MKTYLFLNYTSRHEEVLEKGGGIVPRVLNIGSNWRLVSFMTRPLYPRGKSPRYPLHRMLGLPQSRSGLNGEEKTSHHCLCRKL